jgi:hypothetical protein
MLQEIKSHKEIDNVHRDHSRDLSAKGRYDHIVPASLFLDGCFRCPARGFPLPAPLSGVTWHAEGTAAQG